MPVFYSSNSKFFPQQGPAVRCDNDYDDYVNKRITEVNGKKIHNLRDLIRTVEDNPETPYVVFKTKSNKTIALDRQKAEAEQAGILKTYQIAADRSINLKTMVSQFAEGGRKFVGMVSLDSNM